MNVNNKTLACTVNNDLYRQVEEAAERRHMKKSQLTRIALQEYLEEGSNRPAEAALLVQMGNQLEAIKNSIDPNQYRELTKTLDNIIVLKR